MIAHKKMWPVLLKPRLQLLKNVFCLNCCITSGENTCYKFLTVYFSFDINILRGRGRKLSVMYSPQKWLMSHDSRSNSLRSQTHTRLAVKSSVVLRPEQSEVFYILQSATFFSNLVND
jgi:hypothetical protein